MLSLIPIFIQGISTYFELCVRSVMYHLNSKVRSTHLDVLDRIHFPHIDLTYPFKTNPFEFIIYRMKSAKWQLHVYHSKDNREHISSLLPDVPNVQYYALPYDIRSVSRNQAFLIFIFSLPSLLFLSSFSSL